MDDVKKDRLVVYTALFGDYDELIDPPEMFSGCDFVCFTDQAHLKSDAWEVRFIKDSDLPPNMMNRKYKILPHYFLSEYEFSLYVDANVEVKKNPSDLLVKYVDDHLFYVPKHPRRNCLYSEAIACSVVGKANKTLVDQQVRYYLNNKFPKKFGLSENNVLLRRHNDPIVIDVMEDWWGILNEFAPRDQLSLSYVLWKKNLRYKFMDESARNVNDLYFYAVPHKFSGKESFSKLAFNNLVLSWKVFLFQCFNIIF